MKPREFTRRGIERANFNTIAPGAPGKAMNLCHIVPSLEQRHGGPSKSVYELTSALAREGHGVELLATEPAGGSVRNEQNLEIRTFRREWPQSLCPSSGLRRRVGQIQADVIHHHALWLRTLHYARWAAVRTGAAFVVSPRGMMSKWAWNHHRWQKRLANGFVHPGALPVVRGWHATSDGEAAEIRARGFTQPICIAPNGIAAPQPEEAAEAVRYWNAACPETAVRPVALFYSRFHRKKRLLELIDLWAEHGPLDWLLLIVGIPEEYTTEMLENYVLQASGNRRVRVFNGGARPPPYGVASLFLLPSHNENFGLVIAEALSHGVPALVTDTTPWHSLNEHGGWCAPWEDYGRALKAAVAEDPQNLRARGARAREWVLRDYSWEKPARDLAEFYRRIRDTPPAQAR